MGTLLAGVSTALPESAIPVIAIVRDYLDGDDVAIGAILGAPFMLATVAMALVGLTAIAYRRRREQGRALRAHTPTVRRDVLVSTSALAGALLVGLGLLPRGALAVAAVTLVAVYLVYVRATIRRGGRAQPEHELGSLVVDPTKEDPPATAAIAAQFVVGLACIVAGRSGAGEHHRRDGLPATIPVAIGLAFTDWRLDRVALLATGLAVGGGLVAHWSLSRRRRFSVAAIVAWSGLFGAFVVGALTL